MKEEKSFWEKLKRWIDGDEVLLDADEKEKQLEKQIAALESKMRREKQLNRQMEMNAELKKLRRECERIK